MKKTFSILIALALVLSFSMMAVPVGPVLASPGNLYVDDGATADGTVITCKSVGVLGPNELYASGTPGPFQGYNVGDVVEFISGTADRWVTTIATKYNNNRVALASMYSGGDFSDGTFNLVDLDAPSSGDPFRYIQSAITIASASDTIDVAAGTYTEYLHITTDGLTVQGAGIDQSIIDLDGLTPYWHYGTSKSFASRGGVLISGYQSTLNIVEDVTFKGFTVKNAGLNPPITATGTHTGANNSVALTDSTKSWTPGALVGQWIHNYGDRDTDYNPARSYGQITANTATTVTATLTGGMENDWDTGDQYVITSYEHFIDQFSDGHEDVRGIEIGGGKNILIQHCKVVNSGYGGIIVTTPRVISTVNEGVTIDSCISSDHPVLGINVQHYKGPVTIINNTCNNNKRPHLADPTREYSGTGIYVVGEGSSMTVSGGVISSNECHDNGYHGITVSKYVNNITIDDNIVTGSNFDEDGAGIFAEGSWGHLERCHDITVEDNTVTGNIRGIVVYNAHDCTVDGNTVTTDSGTWASGQAAIKLDNAYNIEVKNNTISCDGVGIRVTSCNSATKSHDNTITRNIITAAKFAGVRITSGAHDNTFTCNTITGTTVLTIGAETQGDGVFIDDNAGTGNVFHNNNIYDNADDGMENQIATEVDAENNWWGDTDGSGPYDTSGTTDVPSCTSVSGAAMMNTDGTGDEVVGPVDYCPWLDYSVSTTTGTGTASFTVSPVSPGCIKNLTAISTPPSHPVQLPHGMFSFNVFCINPGDTVTITITLPAPVPVGTKWWKYQGGSWYWLPIGDDDGDSTITVTLTDNGQGDADSTPGQITDPGGPGYTATAWQLDISSNEGGSVVTPGEGTFYFVNPRVTLFASPDAGYKFVNWSGDVDTIADVHDASTTFSLWDPWDLHYSITANFATEEDPLAEEYTLTISSTPGGSVISPGEGTSTYEAGTVVNLVASPDDGYEFFLWTGNGITQPDSATTTVTMNGDYSIMANFDFEQTTTDSTEGSSGPLACFIATAAYGTPTAEQIDVLREFRDVVLLESAAGSQFVALYYQLSPPIADFIAGNELLRTVVRELLVDPVVGIVEATGAMWRN